MPKPMIPQSGSESKRLISRQPNRTITPTANPPTQSTQSIFRFEFKSITPMLTVTLGLCHAQRRNNLHTVEHKSQTHDRFNDWAGMTINASSGPNSTDLQRISVDTLAEYARPSHAWEEEGSRCSHFFLERVASNSLIVSMISSGSCSGFNRGKPALSDSSFSVFQASCNEENSSWLIFKLVFEFLS